MWFKKQKNESQSLIMKAATALIDLDRKEDTMHQLASLAAGEIWPRLFGYAIVQVACNESPNPHIVALGLSAVAKKNHISNGSNCLGFSVFYAGLIDPVYSPPAENVRSFASEVLGMHGESVRIMYGMCQGSVANYGLFDSLSPSGFFPDMENVMSVLASIPYGASRERDFL